MASEEPCEACSHFVVSLRTQLPERFFRLAEEDFPQCDLLIVTGTSLKVQPFASLVGRVREHVPRLLINRERVGESDPMLDMLGLVSPGALTFDEGNYRDAEWLGDCDAGICDLARRLGWEAELELLVASGTTRSVPQPSPTPPSPIFPPTKRHQPAAASPAESLPLQPLPPPQPTSHPGEEPPPTEHAAEEAEGQQ